MKNNPILTIVLLVLTIFIAGCQAESKSLKVMTHDSFSISEEVLNAFEEEYGISVEFIPSGDTGTALNKAILSKGNPIADVFYGVDNTFLSRALEEGIFIPYESPYLEEIPDQFKLDPSNRALPVDFGDVCLNYDKLYFEQLNIQPPIILEDLLSPAYREYLVVENPATSSPGLAFLFSTIGYFGEEGYLKFWNGLIENGTLIVNDWESAYYGEFSASGGNRPLVVSYASSPAFEMIYAETPLAEPPTGAITSDGSCFRQIEFVGILDGAENTKAAQAWVDFMLSTTFQEDIPLQMFVFPVNQNAALSEVFIDFMEIPANPADFSPQEIASNRERWIQEWTESILR